MSRDLLRDWARGLLALALLAGTARSAVELQLPRQLLHALLTV